MNISKISINQFRNHFRTNLEPGKGLNIFYGKNGAGKTSILEAISVGCISRSFSPVTDNALVRNGQQTYSVSLDATAGNDTKYSVEINFTKGLRKKINNTFGENLTPKDILGIVPLVFLTPDQKSITAGPPESRRLFVDRILSQTSKVYLDNLFKFRKALKQRNSLLTIMKRQEAFDYESYSSWTEIFINASVELSLRRNKFIDEYRPFFESSFAEITNNSEKSEIAYLPHSIETGNLRNISEESAKDSMAEDYRMKAKFLFPAERARGITLFGPQKDEVTILINGGNSRERASQGQHKSILIAMIFAEFEYLLNSKTELPIVLLDDIFSELDEYRTALVLTKVLDRNVQTFVTLTNPDLIDKSLMEQSQARYYQVNEGIIENVR